MAGRHSPHESIARAPRENPKAGVAGERAGQPKTFRSPTQNSGMFRIHFTQYDNREELAPLPVIAIR